jgi:type I restriction enzyme S subunit
MDAEFRPTYWCGDAGLLNQRVFLATSPIGGRAFTRELLRAPLAFIESYKTGTTVSHLNKSDLDAITVVLPEASEIERFDSIAEALRELLIAVHQETSALAEMRDTLIPRLFSGELRVRDAA